MDKPKLCTATWTRDGKVQWWAWEWDGKEYIKDGNVMSQRELMVLSAQMQMEGWELCRAVV